MTSPKESLPEAVRKEIEQIWLAWIGDSELGPEVERIALLAFTEGRRAGLEDAAKVADKHGEGTSGEHQGEHCCGVDDDCAAMIATAIRALKEKP